MQGILFIFTFLKKSRVLSRRSKVHSDYGLLRRDTVQLVMYVVTTLIIAVLALLDPTNGISLAAKSHINWI